METPEIPKKPSKKCKTCYGSGEYRKLVAARYELLPDCPRCDMGAGRSCKQHRKEERWEARVCGCVEVRP